MIKKITLGLIFTLITGALIIGGVNRTNAKSAQYDPAQPVAQTGDGTGQNGNGGGQNRDSERQYANQHEPLSQEKEISERNGQGQEQGNGSSTANNETNSPLGGQGQGNTTGNGQGNGAQNQGTDRYGNPEDPTSHDEILTFHGTVTTAPAEGIELVINTDEGELTIGTGPSYWLESNISLAVNDDISVTGFWEEGEFKATSLTRTNDNLTVILRDETGRPMWSGSVRNSANEQSQGQSRGQGQGNGNQNADG